MSSDDEEVMYDEIDQDDSDNEDMDVDDDGDVPEFGSDEEEDLELDLRAVARSRVKIKKVHAYDEIGLRSKLEEIKLKINGEEPEWIETVSITADAPLDIPDAQDDLKREAEFYAVTLANVNAAIERFKTIGVPFERPADYYAETVKTDEHMLKLKDSLLADMRRLGEKQERIKQKMAKKYAKQVQVETKQKREKARKEDLDAIKQWRKSGAKDAEGDEVFPEEILDASSTLRKEIRERQQGQSGDKPRPNKKRQYKDKKWGYGGEKRRKKNNDTTSASDTSQWNTKLNKTLPPGMAKGLKKAKRPGKAMRQNQRGRK